MHGEMPKCMLVARVGMVCGRTQGLAPTLKKQALRMLTNQLIMGIQTTQIGCDPKQNWVLTTLTWDCTTCELGFNQQDHDTR